jgi:tetratricopeptide (TPR) repeat protein
MSTPILPTPYESLLDMRTAYNDLARSYRTSLNGEPAEEMLDQASEFIERGRETGALLDNPDERSEAQNMLNFWATLLYRYRRVSGDEPTAAALSAYGSLPKRRDSEVDAAPFQAPLLPADLYVGRVSFIADLKQQLMAGRNIALYSSPGTGKTSIATKLAHDPDLRERYADGVLWARLGEEPDMSNIFRAWGEALNVQSSDDSEQDWFIDHDHATKVIRQALARRRMLLVIDDAWKSDVALALKLGGPHCAHIVTTYLIAVALDFDTQGAVPVPNLDQSDGLHLLAKGAPNAVEQQQAAAAELVATLGNSFLAFSLIANYYRLTGEHPDFAELNRRLLIHTDEIEKTRPSTSAMGNHDEVQTPSSLLATITWLFQQLTPPAVYVLQAFSSFPPKPNSFSDAAARYIAEERSHIIEELVDAGLLGRTANARYSLHRSICEFLKYRKNGQTDLKPEQRMARFYVDLVTSATRDVRQVQVLEEEEKNILAALEIAYKHGMWELVVEGTNALFGYLDRRGMYEIAKETLNRARHAAEKMERDDTLASILLELGEMEERRSEYGPAKQHLQESLDIARRLQDRKICARALQTLGVVVMAQGEYGDAIRHLNEALVLASHIPDSYLICKIETRLGWLDRGVADFVQSRKRTERALALARDNNYPRQIAELELSLGILDFLEGNYEKAKAHDLAGLSHAKDEKDKRLQCALHQALGGVEIELENFKESEKHLMKALHLAIEIGHRWYSGVIWKELGELRLKQNLPNSAADGFKKGFDLAREVNSPELIGMSLYGLARVAALQENFAEARLQGRTCLNIFQSIDHYKTDEVIEWLSSITDPLTA